MDLLKSFQNYIKAENLFLPKERLLLAVSGGVDSVVLCELCYRAGYHFAIAHCNFALRGEESNADEAFVREMSMHYKVPIFVKQFVTLQYAEMHKVSIQVAARELRYQWFYSLLSQPDNVVENNLHTSGGPGQDAFNYLLTAHHADDNIETILMNFFKGSGINGLKGILPKNKNIVRPLLFAGKDVISNFAVENNLAYREDSSNLSDKYTRNYFRHQIIPGIEKVFPQVRENIMNNANRYRDIQVLYNNSIAVAKKKLVSYIKDEVHIPVLKLLKTEALHTVVFEIIKEYGFTPQQVDELIKLLHSDSGKYIQSQSHRILHNRNWLIIFPINNPQADTYLIEEKDAAIHFAAGNLLVEKKMQPAKIDANPLSVQLDAAHISFPLLLRKWKTGDYFYPLGMQKKKKLSRFFVDEKMPLHQKQQTWVIESNKKIIWIVGQRIDDRFKIRESTKACLKFTLQ
ncbi:MAG: tRNA lysidine(34) synthetase TilS [Bacteroidetes bacterium]|nr:tRNA lysidine(34) synthetase TilS [Bacteroidota bacterium]MBS1756422.1 tRNA lysidine(34) synthetase TilS [Bacteroidota bacterium]